MLQAMHVGDSLELDVQGGVNAGLAATVWINRNGIPLPSEAPCPTFSVAHVSELAAILEELQELAPARTSFENYGFAEQVVQHSADGFE